MPPIRTLSMAKPIKTERTHEENQERAYIAASRRSDRSLEARIESARRASEIHKRRTGRSLRVTEQDVVNEEMYEEEDDDLPMQYRRLTAHLDTNSADFNRRLAAYLTNHVAMRSALNQAISNSYPDQAQTQQQWSPSNQSMQQPTWPQPAPQFSDGVVPPQMLHRMSTPQHRHQPYPTTFDQRTQARTHSTSPVEMRKPALSSKPRPSASHDAQGETSRRSSNSSSTLSGNQASGMQTSYRSMSNGSTSSMKVGPSQDHSERISTIPPPSRSNSAQRQSTGQMSAPYTPYQQGWGSSQHMGPGPLTTAMPLETQMYFGGSNGFNTEYDAFGSMKMHMPVFQDTFDKNNFSYPYVSGMSQTLAPGAMDDEALSWPTPTSVTESDFSSGNNFTYSIGDFDGDMYPKPIMAGNPFASGQITPADNDWSSFINTSSWEENET